MIAVTGATGNVGQSLVRELAEDGEKVVAISRGAKDIRMPEGVTHRRADIADPDALAAAVAGASALFLLITGDQLITGPEPERVLAAVEAAGVRKVVFLSSQGAVTRSGSGGYARTLAFETALRGSDLSWTVLRPGGFFSNTFAWADSVRAHRAVAAPFGDIALPAVDPADIAAVAAAVLRSDEHHGRAYTLTGPEAVSPRAQAHTLADVLGEPVRFTELTRDEARTGMLRFMPDSVADHTLSILGEPVPAELEVSPDVEAVLGRPAGSYAQWAERSIAAFR
ncbi:uncharacterized protein YbjT (DUF2867 family) [Nocardia transvalensis]|uniref:Uncharacterized protein YbjT (DUF2867 family) n=1 Tax=Nocardia transvalensis TaxID=37333 RepID=A0A7W9UJU9_9NOCA|nr:NAD(P)H-binding protein [Nocardia transvalensis]MBB5915829.1 uncharacterized protein YbjT (DUF2867 family) [Nocardia transvalensis]